MGRADVTALLQACFQGNPTLRSHYPDDPEGVAVALMAGAGWFAGVPHIRRDAYGALFQVFNWVKLGAGESYADLTAVNAGLRKPLEHYWSLAIEEQFYWVWPVAFVGLMAVGRRVRRSPVAVIGVLAAVFAVANIVVLEAPPLC